MQGGEEWQIQYTPSKKILSKVIRILLIKTTTPAATITIKANISKQPHIIYYISYSFCKVVFITFLSPVVRLLLDLFFIVF